MKFIPLVIVASLAANAALLGAFFLRSPSDSSSSASRSGRTVSAPATSASTSTASNPTVGVDPALWKEIGDPNLPSQISRLREGGFPPKLIRAIISAQINETFAARRKALSPAPASPTEFWKNDPPADPKNRAALRDLALQQNRMLTDLLGPDPAPNGLNSLYERRQYAGIPADKMEAAARIRRDYAEMQQDALAGFTGGVIAGDDRAKLDLLRREEQVDIAKLLTPQEFEDYELRTSNTANQMRYDLGSFNPSEAEFRAIFALRKTYDEKYRVTSAAQAAALNSNQDVIRERQEAQKQLTDQIKATLGPQRAADYERATDYNYQAIDRVVTRLGLPDSVSTNTYALQKDIQQRLQALQQNRTLTPEARNAELANLNTEATAKLTASLGQRGFDVYKQNGGNWLQNLQPRPAAPAGARGAAPLPTGGSTTIRIGN